MLNKSYFQLLRILLSLSFGMIYALGFAATSNDAPYLFGLAKADITGEAAEVGMMGYANLAQKTSGIHMRQWARAFIVEDRISRQRVVYVNCDLGMIFQSVHQGVLRKLQEKYKGLYNDNNVMLAATHTHAGPGGFSHYALYNITILGFQEKTYNAIVDGIVRAIDRAHNKMTPGRLFIGKGELTNASANRSLASHLQNPDIKGYENGIDPEMTVLKFIDSGNKLNGVISWFPVHGTSMTNANTLISPDNKGVAAYHWEHDVSGDPQFVAAFAQTNAGNLTPNLNLKPGSGPFDNEFKNTKEIGLRQFNKAKDIADQQGEEIKGPIDTRFQNIDFTALTVRPEFGDGQKREMCEAALGSSMAAGSTEDGPGPFGIPEANNPFLSFLGGVFTGVPSVQARRCQGEKEILLDTGAKKPYPWTPNILPIQMIRIGQVTILGAPAEFTVMAGVTIRRAVQGILAPLGITHVIFNSYANAYADYVTTREEYAQQEYEAGSTIFGPWEQRAFQQLFADMATAMRNGMPVASTGTPPDLSCCQANFQTGVVADDPPIGYHFGDVLIQPNATYRPGDTVTVEFVTGHPKNNLHDESTFLTVIQLPDGDGGSQPQVIATDNDWNTRYRWQRVGISASKAIISWEIPADAKPGRYLIEHYGDAKDFRTKQISPFTGRTRLFEVLGANKG